MLLQDREVQRAGLVGLGGAGFPAHVKLNVSPEVKLDTLILNGAECEPYITADHRIMVEHADEVVEGAKISSLKRFKDDVKEVVAGYECGIGLDRFDAFETGDFIEAYIQEKVKAELAAPSTRPVKE